ncbi:unnamed protein product [Heligmosomoides polygyrus]|uniref:Peptidase M10 metallopeptidase domain-containing protein n=1 Tax=Heligmosomoides polygyrus TaxID=6339 RepID=A0A3P8ABB8_HELPZ|nr:unnamed protein product [Heligmosomoides polygyrus]
MASSRLWLLFVLHVFPLTGPDISFSTSSLCVIPDGIVAHAFYPRDGRLHFDADEDWSLNSRHGVNLYEVWHTTQKTAGRWRVRAQNSAYSAQKEKVVRKNKNIICFKTQESTHF